MLKRLIYTKRRKLSQVLTHLLTHSLTHSLIQLGANKTGAEFQVGLLGMKFGYYLMLNHEPRHNTFTWTLDYR